MPNTKNNNSSTNKPFSKINRDKYIFYIITVLLLCLIAGIIITMNLDIANNEKEIVNIKPPNPVIENATVVNATKPVIPIKEDATVQIHPSGSTIKIFKSDDKNKNNRAIIVIPGGGYGFISEYTEGYNCVPLLKKLGYTTAVLYYTVPPKSPDGPLNEIIGAMRYLRNTTNNWNVDTGLIGVMGFSAGGHLAATASTRIKNDERPAFQILYYPVITMDRNTTHLGSRDRLIGLNPTQELVDLYSIEKQVTDETPPAYVCWPDDDLKVPTINSISYVEALKSKGIPVQTKNFKKGGHGFGFNKTFEFYDEMIEDLTKWLKNIDKILTKKVSSNRKKNSL